MTTHSAPITEDLAAYFTDVEHLREWFQAAVSAPTLPKRLLVIHGVGGVGKSSLLRMFRLHCKSVRAPVALIDKANSPVDILADWADDLKADGVALPKFAKTFAHYRAIQAQAEEQAKKTPGARSKAADVAGKAATKTAEAAGGAMVGAAIGSVVPGVGAAVGGALGGVLGGIGTPRPDTISLIPEGIPLLEAERIAREREPGDGRPQVSVVEKIGTALR